MVTLALLNIKNSLTLDIADSSSHFIATNITIDSLAKQSYIAPYYPLNNVNIFGKHPTENIYTCDYKTYKTRFSNNMLSQSEGKPSEKDFYIEWATSLGLDYGFIAQEGDILGKGEGLNVDWDFYYLMHGGKHSSIGWGIGFGYNEKMFNNNQPVYSSSQNFSYDNKYYIGACHCAYR